MEQIFQKNKVVTGNLHSFLHEKLRFYNNKIISVLKVRLFIYSYYYGEKVFINPLFMISPFYSRHSICLIRIWQSSFDGNDVFSILWFQLKNGAPVFWERFLSSRKFVSKLKYWKRLKLSLIVTWKPADLSNRGIFWKSLVRFFRRTYALSVGFKMKTLRKSVFEF